MTAGIWYAYQGSFDVGLWDTSFDVFVKGALESVPVTGDRGNPACGPSSAAGLLSPFLHRNINRNSARMRRRSRVALWTRSRSIICNPSFEPNCWFPLEQRPSSMPAICREGPGHRFACCNARGTRQAAPRRQGTPRCRPRCRWPAAPDPGHRVVPQGRPPHAVCGEDRCSAGPYRRLRRHGRRGGGGSERLRRVAGQVQSQRGRGSCCDAGI